jgi:hypothetical protein
VQLTTRVSGTKLKQAKGELPASLRPRMRPRVALRDTVDLPAWARLASVEARCILRSEGGFPPPTK